MNDIDISEDLESEPFKEIDFFTPVIEFLKSYPNIGDDTLISITPVMFDSFARDGSNSLGIAGSTQIRETKTIMGNVILSQRVNFQLYIRRNFRDESFFLPAGMFVQNLPLWINIENGRRNSANQSPLLPKFSNFEDGKDNITSDGGTIWRQVEGTEQGVFDLMIQIHVDYEILIENEEW